MPLNIFIKTFAFVVSFLCLRMMLSVSKLAACRIISVYYANTPIKYTAIFHGCKNDNFQMKNCEILS